MAIQSRHWVDAERGMLDRCIFTDEQVYQEELEKVFGQAWLFIGHESLIPNPNDFFLTYMGEDPVILTRDSKGALHAFLNMCRHRGNRVVRADDGNAKNFMCTYHGWTFSNEGRLVSVPGLQEAYYGELDVEHLGLVPVAHLESYAGMVFATWAEDAPTLEAYLGDMRWYLDTRYNNTDNGIQAIGPLKWIVPANWKVPVDNAAGDMYHGPVTHQSSHMVQAQFKGTNPAQITDGKYSNRTGWQVYLGNGHGGHVTVLKEAGSPREGDQSTRAAVTMAYRKAVTPQAIRRLGEYRATRVQPGHWAVFPNLFLGLRLALPRGPLKTEVWSFEHFDKDAPDELKREIRLRAIQNGAGHPGGTHAQDDMDNWRNVTDGGRSVIARRSRQDLSMAINHATQREEVPGSVVAYAFGERNQLGYYARWQEFMNAEGWADIHIDPITAKFEGTATMRG